MGLVGMVEAEHVSELMQSDPMHVRQGLEISPVGIEGEVSPVEDYVRLGRGVSGAEERSHSQRVSAEALAVVRVFKGNCCLPVPVTRRSRRCLCPGKLNVRQLFVPESHRVFNDSVVGEAAILERE